MEVVLMKKNFLAVMFVVYFLILTWIIVFKMSFSLEELGHIRSLNLIPLKGSVIVNGKLDAGEILQNVIAFIPLGVFIRALAGKRNLSREIAAAALISIAYETLQFILEIGRTDITDVLANTIGGIIGIMVCAAIEKICGREDRFILVISICTGIGTFAVAGLVALLLLANNF